MKAGYTERGQYRGRANIGWCILFVVWQPPQLQQTMRAVPRTTVSEIESKADMGASVDRQALVAAAFSDPHLTQRQPAEENEAETITPEQTHATVRVSRLGHCVAVARDNSL